MLRKRSLPGRGTWEHFLETVAGPQRAEKAVQVEGTEIWQQDGRKPQGSQRWDIETHGGETRKKVGTGMRMPQGAPGPAASGPQGQDSVCLSQCSRLLLGRAPGSILRAPEG